MILNGMWLQYAFKLCCVDLVFHTRLCRRHMLTLLPICFRYQFRHYVLWLVHC
jgi:hypothetical protein